MKEPQQGELFPEVAYKEIPGFPGYRVGDDGSVWSRLVRKGRGTGYGTKTVIGDVWRQLAVKYEKKSGYPLYYLSNTERVRYARAGVLVLEAFVGPRPERMECCHEDGNPKNNRLSNLRWGTARSNQHDRFRHGTASVGEKHGRSKLKEADVYDIRQRIKDGECRHAIAKSKGVSFATVSLIGRGKSWSHI